MDFISGLDGQGWEKKVYVGKGRSLLGNVTSVTK